MDSSAMTPVQSAESVAVDPSLYVLPSALALGTLPSVDPDAAGVITIVPRRSTQWTLALWSILPLLTILVSISLMDDGALFWPIVGVPALLPLVAIGAGVVFRARVVVTPDRVGLRGLFGFRWFDRTSLGRLLIVRGYDSAFSASGGYTDAFLFDKNGKRVIRLSGQVWDESRVQVFHAALGLPTHVRQGPTRRRDLRAEEPRALDWPEAHPLAFIAIALSVLFGGLLLLTGVGIALLVTSFLS